MTDFESDEKGDSLHTVVAPIDVVPHEQIVSVGYIPTDFKQLHKVVELAMDIPTNHNRSPHRHNIRLLDKNLLSLS